MGPVVQWSSMSSMVSSYPLLSFFGTMLMNLLLGIEAFQAQHQPLIVLKLF